ncbi:MAG: asparagine synthase C-terminal domain-containing protein [Candidatus Diapherotrites archaeon]|nr:asparagine synthase C-terminal domain-containing protein [Candidatus Diapherotrites archaeon]
MSAVDFFKNTENILLLQKNLPKSSNLKDLQKAFDQSIQTQTQNVSKAAVLFSGGIDSSLIALAVSQKVKNTVLFCAGTSNSSVFARAHMAANLLNLPLKFQTITKTDVDVFAVEVKKILGTDNFLQIQIALAEFLAMRAVKISGFKTVFCGQGADELFAGYTEFRKVFDRGELAVQNLSWKKLENLWQDNLARDLALADYLNLDLRAPYLDPEFMKIAMALPVAEKIHSSHDLLRKHALRSLGLSLGLPELIALQPKKAIQYDSGVSKELKKLNKKKKVK